MIKICPTCSQVLKKKKILLPIFRHFDYNTVNKEFVLNVCLFCNLYLNLSNFFSQREKFKTIEYSKDSLIRPRQIFYKGQIKSKNFYLSKNLSKLISYYKIQTIFDIGCGNGELINFLNVKQDNKMFYGIDFKNFKKNFKIKKNQKFISTELNKKINFKQKSLVIFSQSIYYLTITEIKNYIKNITLNSHIFIEIPNLKKNLFSFLMGDVYFVPFQQTIFSIMRQFGCKLIKICKIKNFDREHAFLFKKTSNKKFKTNKSKINIDSLIKKIDLEKNLIKSLPKKNYLIFGNSCKSAFIDYYLNESKGFVVNKKYKKNFRSKPLILIKSNMKDIIFPDKRLFYNQKLLKINLEKKRNKIL